METSYQDDESNEEQYVVKAKTKSRTNTGAGTYTVTKQYQTNPNFFNDIFNVSLRLLFSAFVIYSLEF